MMTPTAGPNHPILISLCMIVRDEADNLPRCLQSVRGLVDQLIVVDTGSRDRTVEIAAQYGAEMYQFAWRNNFAEARNYTLQQARGQWILILDADEEIAEGQTEMIRALTETIDADAFGFCVRNWAAPGNLTRYSDSLQIRLFRHGRNYGYEQAVHNQILPSIIRQGGQVRDTSIVIHHYGYIDKQEEKARRALPMLEAELAQNPGNAYLYFKLGEVNKALGRNQAAIEALERSVGSAENPLPPHLTETAFMRLAQIALAMDDYGKAIHYSHQSLTLNPSNLVARYVSGIALLYAGQVGPAYDHFQIIAAQPTGDYFDRSDLQTLMGICESILKASHQ